MAKLVLDDIGSTLTNTAATTINNNNTKIEQALENTLSRDGSTPNNMQADIDMDSNDILNVDNIHTNVLVLNGEVVQTVSLEGALKASNALSEIAVLGLEATARDNINAASDVQGAKADTAVQPNTSPTLNNLTLTGALNGPVRKFVTLEQFGGGPLVDNATAMTNASNSLASTHGGMILLKPGVRYPINSAVVLGRNVGIMGEQYAADPGNNFGDATQFLLFLQTVGGLVFGSSGKIRFGTSGGAIGVYCFASVLNLDGLDLPTNYVGSCFEAGTVSEIADSNYVLRCTLLGFETPLVFKNAARYRIENNLIDADNGFDLDTSGDFGRLVGNHLFGILQDGATGHDTFSLRSGTAFKFSGSPLGGAYLINNFDYGYNIGIDIVTQGQIVIRDHWSDGPTAIATGRPLDIASIGLRTAALDYLESMVSGYRISSKGTAILTGTSTKGLGVFTDLILHNNNVGFNCNSQNLSVNNFIIRAYDSAFIFNTNTAANTALLTNGQLYDRNPPGAGLTGIPDPIDINAGTGKPVLVSVSRVDGNFDLRNELRPDVTAASNIITLPGPHEFVRVVGAPTVNNIAPAYDGRRITCEASGAGLVFSNAGNFLFSTGTSWTSTQAGACITFVYSRFINKWVEVARGPL